MESSQPKYKEIHDKHQVDYHFQVGNQVWLHINTERLQGEGRKLKPNRHGPFTILDQVGNNAFRLYFPPYMQMYYVVNVEKFKLYEPPMIVDQDVQVQVPFVNEFAPDYLNEIQEDVICDKKARSS